MTEEMSYQFVIDVPVGNDWTNVELLVTSVHNCFLAMFCDVEGCQTIAMVTGELLENAIKYGSWGGRRLFRLSVSGIGRTAIVTVENPTEKVHSERLAGVLRWLGTFSSPEEAYRSKLIELAGRPKGTSGGNLGILRIAQEARCSISAECSGNLVRVTATIPL